MNDDLLCTILTISIILNIVFLIGGALVGKEVRSLRKQAVENKAAVWVVDVEGNTKFEWIKNQNPQPQTK